MISGALALLPYPLFIQLIKTIIANTSSGVGDSCVSCQNIDGDTIVPITVAALSSRVQPYVRLRRQLSSGTVVQMSLYSCLLNSHPQYFEPILIHPLLRVASLSKLTNMNINS